MAGTGRYRVVGDVSLGGTARSGGTAGAAFTTGDHDGIAVVVAAIS